MEDSYTKLTIARSSRDRGKTSCMPFPIHAGDFVGLILYMSLTYSAICYDTLCEIALSFLNKYHFGELIHYVWL